MKIKIHAIYISSGHDFVGRYGKGRLDHGIQKVNTVECIAGRGLVGDRYFDHAEDFKGQITFFDWAVYRDISVNFELEELHPEKFRRNALVEGIDLNTLIGEKFTLQGVEFEGVEECRPCFWMDETISPGVHEALKGHGGLRAKILKTGTLECSASELLTLE